MWTMFSGGLYTIQPAWYLGLSRIIPCKSWSDRTTNKPLLIDWKQTEFEFKIIPRNDLNNKSIMDKNGNFFMIITGIRWDFRNNYGFNIKIQINLFLIVATFRQILNLPVRIGIYRPFYNLCYHSLPWPIFSI